MFSPLSGEPLSGEPLSGEPLSGEPLSGEPLSIWVVIGCGAVDRVRWWEAMAVGSDGGGK